MTDKHKFVFVDQIFKKAKNQNVHFLIMLKFLLHVPLTPSYFYKQSDGANSEKKHPGQSYKLIYVTPDIYGQQNQHRKSFICNVFRILTV